MAENVTLNPVVTFSNDTTAVNTVNGNYTTITNAFTDVLSRSGVSPNQMGSTLDMNSNQIINLPPPSTTNSPARLIDVVSNINTLTLNNYQLIGDVTTPLGSGTQTSTLATVNSNVGTFGNSSQTPVVTVNGKGLVTAVTTVNTASNLPSNITNPASVGNSNALYPLILPTSFRYDANSALITNTIGCKFAVIGVPSIDANVTWLNTYLVGIDSAASSIQGPTTLEVVSPNGFNVFATGVRTSDQLILTPANIIADSAVCLHNNTSVGHLTWCRYDAGIVTATAFVSHHINYETDIHNLASVVAQDPFNVNPNGSCEGIRIASGIPGIPGGTPNDASSYLVLTNNAAKAVSGIIIANGSLDTVLNTNPPAIALPSAYALTWYSAAATVSGRVYIDSSSNLWLNSAGTNIQGVVNASNAPAGYVGEVISSSITTPVSMSNGTGVNLTNISLTAGDWDVWFDVYFNPAGTTSITGLVGSIALTTGTIDLGNGNFSAISTAAQVPGASNVTSLTVGPRRVNVSSTTSVFANAQGNFTVSTLTATGILRARRIR